MTFIGLMLNIAELGAWGFLAYLGALIVGMMLGLRAAGI